MLTIYVFTLVNVGDFGSNNDSGVLENSAMGKAFASNQMGLPDEQHVEGCKIPLPYCFGDDILALRSWFLQSFPRWSKLSEDQQLGTGHKVWVLRGEVEGVFQTTTIKFGTPPQKKPSENI